MTEAKRLGRVHATMIMIGTGTAIVIATGTGIVTGIATVITVRGSVTMRAMRFSAARRRSGPRDGTAGARPVGATATYRPGKRRKLVARQLLGDVIGAGKSAAKPGGGNNGEKCGGRHTSGVSRQSWHNKIHTLGLCRGTMCSAMATGITTGDSPLAHL